LASKCRIAWSDYSVQNDGKIWKYLLVPHDAVASNATLGVLVNRFTVQ
jgi:hypothetical protein